MLLKIRSINELLRFSGNRLLGGEEKKSVVVEKMYISNKLPELNELRQSALKIIIFRLFSFFLELTFYLLLFIHFISCVCTTPFQIRTCVPCVQVATPQKISV